VSCEFSTFVAGAKAGYIKLTETHHKEFNMNWVFETYSNVYSTAMMQDTKFAPKASIARKSLFVRLFGRG
jgi:hypothetical protein